MPKDKLIPLMNPARKSLIIMNFLYNRSYIQMQKCSLACKVLQTLSILNLKFWPGYFLSIFQASLGPNFKSY